LIGQMLDIIPPPYNYPAMFIGLSLGGLISYYFSSQIHLADHVMTLGSQKQPLANQVSNYVNEIGREKPFVSFLIKRFVFLTGTTLASPLIPLYFVHQANLSDGWIAIINTVQTAVLVFAYSYWAMQSRKRSTRWVLLGSTLGVSLYPILAALTILPIPQTVLAGLVGIFQAGVDLVFFDELMRTVPSESSATFISFAQSVQYVSTIFAPMLGTALSAWIGLPAALMISGGIRLIGFAMFAIQGKPILKMGSLG
jgi:hypothetical protein